MPQWQSVRASYQVSMDKFTHNLLKSCSITDILGIYSDSSVVKSNSATI